MNLGRRQARFLLLAGPAGSFLDQRIEAIDGIERCLQTGSRTLQLVQAGDRLGFGEVEVCGGPGRALCPHDLAGTQVPIRRHHSVHTRRGPARQVSADHGELLRVLRQVPDLLDQGVRIGGHAPPRDPGLDAFREAAQRRGEYGNGEGVHLRQGVAEGFRDGGGQQGQVGGEFVQQSAQVLPVVLKDDVDPAPAEEPFTAFPGAQERHLGDVEQARQGRFEEGGALAGLDAAGNDHAQLSVPPLPGGHRVVRERRQSMRDDRHRVGIEPRIDQGLHIAGGRGGRDANHGRGRVRILLAQAPPVLRREAVKLFVRPRVVQGALEIAPVFLRMDAQQGPCGKRVMQHLHRGQVRAQGIEAMADQGRDDDAAHAETSTNEVEHLAVLVMGGRHGLDRRLKPPAREGFLEPVAQVERESLSRTRAGLGSFRTKLEVELASVRRDVGFHPGGHAAAPAVRDVERHGQGFRVEPGQVREQGRGTLAGVEPGLQAFGHGAPGAGSADLVGFQVFLPVHGP